MIRLVHHSGKIVDLNTRDLELLQTLTQDSVSDSSRPSTSIEDSHRPLEFPTRVIRIDVQNVFVLVLFLVRQASFRVPPQFRVRRQRVTSLVLGYYGALDRSSRVRYVEVEGCEGCRVDGRTTNRVGV